MRRAADFGFTGPLYEEAFPQTFPTEGGEPILPITPYYAFDGEEVLTLTGSGVFYENRALELEFPSTIPFEQSGAIATAFWRERGVLNFSHVVEPGFGGEVLFKRVIDGRPINQPEAYVSVNNAGEVVFASFDVLPNLSEIGPYPLISAETGWERVLGGVVENAIPYEIRPLENEGPVVPDEEFGDFQFWTRAYQPGYEVTFFTNPLIYLPANGEGDPLIKVFDFTLSAPPEELEALSYQVVQAPQTFRIVGTVGADGRTLELVSWEPVSDVQPLFVEGVIDRTAEGVLLRSADGTTYTLPEAPADLPNEQAVFAFAWSSRDEGAEFPILEWENLEKRIEFSEEGERPTNNDPFSDPFYFTNVTITEVGLGYYYQPIWVVAADGAAEYDAPPVLIQPVWQFGGTVVNSEGGSERITFFVQAVEPEYLQGQ